MGMCVSIPVSALTQMQWNERVPARELPMTRAIKTFHKANIHNTLMIYLCFPHDMFPKLIRTRRHTNEYGGEPAVTGGETDERVAGGREFQLPDKIDNEFA